MKWPHIGIQCVTAFNSAKHLKFHLLDVHCPDFIKQLSVLETPGECDLEPARFKIPRRSLKKKPAVGKNVKWECRFIEETAEMVYRNKVSTVATANSSRFTSLLGGPQCWSGTDIRSATSTETPPSPLDSGTLPVHMELLIEEKTFPDPGHEPTPPAIDYDRNCHTDSPTLRPELQPIHLDLTKLASCRSRGMRFRATSSLFCPKKLQVFRRCLLFCSSPHRSLTTINAHQHHGQHGWNLWQ